VHLGKVEQPVHATRSKQLLLQRCPLACQLEYCASSPRFARSLIGGRQQPPPNSPQYPLPESPSPSANITQQSPASFSRKSSNWSSSVSKSFVKTSGAQPCAQASLSRGRRVPLFLQAAPVRCLHTFPHSPTTCSGSFSCSFTFCSHDDKSPRLNISPPAIFMEYQECRVRCMCSASSQSCLLDPAHWGVLQPISREPRPHPH